jgi:hypothetical protein
MLSQYIPALKYGNKLDAATELDTSGALTYTGAVTLSSTLGVTGLLTATGGVTVPTGKTLAATDSAGITANSVIIPAYEILNDNQNQVAAASYAVSHTIFVNDNVSGTYKVAAVSASFGTASVSGTLQVEVATGTQAIAGGTNQLTGTISLAGTANTTVNGTVIGSPTTIAAGNRINLIFGGTVTSLANATITVVLQRLS